MFGGLPARGSWCGAVRLNTRVQACPHAHACAHTVKGFSEAMWSAFELMWLQRLVTLRRQHPVLARDAEFDAYPDDADCNVGAGPAATGCMRSPCSGGCSSCLPAATRAESDPVAPPSLRDTARHLSGPSPARCTSAAPVEAATACRADAPLRPGCAPTAVLGTPVRARAGVAGFARSSLDRARATPLVTPLRGASDGQARPDALWRQGATSGSSSPLPLGGRDGRKRKRTVLPAVTPAAVTAGAVTPDSHAPMTLVGSPPAMTAAPGFANLLAARTPLPSGLPALPTSLNTATVAPPSFTPMDAMRATAGGEALLNAGSRVASLCASPSRAVPTAPLSRPESASSAGIQGLLGPDCLHAVAPPHPLPLDDGALRRHLCPGVCDTFEHVRSALAYPDALPECRLSDIVHSWAEAELQWEVRESAWQHRVARVLAQKERREQYWLRQEIMWRQELAAAKCSADLCGPAGLLSTANVDARSAHGSPSRASVAMDSVPAAAPVGQPAVATLAALAAATTIATTAATNFTTAATAAAGTTLPASISVALAAPASVATASKQDVLLAELRTILATLEAAGAGGDLAGPMGEHDAVWAAAAAAQERGHDLLRQLRSRPLPCLTAVHAASWQATSAAVPCLTQALNTDASSQTEQRMPQAAGPPLSACASATEQGEEVGLFNCRTDVAYLGVSLGSGADGVVEEVLVKGKLVALKKVKNSQVVSKRATERELYHHRKLRGCPYFVQCLGACDSVKHRCIALQRMDCRLSQYHRMVNGCDGRPLPEEVCMRARLLRGPRRALTAVRITGAAAGA